MTVSELTCEEKRISKLDCCEAEGEMTAIVERFTEFFDKIRVGVHDSFPPYSIVHICPKCEYPHIQLLPKMRYVRRLGIEAMQYTCAVCGARWYTQCADATK
jgi:hypothetical protein